MIADKNAKNIGYPSQFAVLCMSTGGGIILSVLATGLIWVVMEGASLPTDVKSILQPRYYNVNMVIQVVTTFLIFFLPVIFFAAICYRKPMVFLGYNLTINYRQVVLVLLILLVSFLLDIGLVELNRILPIPQKLALKFKQWENDRAAEEAILLQINSFSKYLVSLVVIALLPALFEETYFRAGLQNLLSRWFKGPWIAIIFTSIIFSLVHLSYYGFLVRLGLGVILGLVYYYSGSVWLSILFHFLFNGIQVTILYLTSSAHSPDPLSTGPYLPVWILLPALLLIIYLLKVFKRVSAPSLAVIRSEKPEDDLYEWTRNQPK